MPKIDQVLIDLVKEEAAKLRKNLLKEEAERLNFNSLNPESASRCIYGQATGNCHGERATTLIRRCCSQTYNAEGVHFRSAKLNGKPLKKVIHSSENWRDYRHHFSPIEVFIAIAGKRRNKKLIQYLRKETDTLDI